jgi:signal transduction histidine kinase
MHPVATEGTSASQALDRAIARAVSRWREPSGRPSSGEDAPRIECLAEQMRTAASSGGAAVRTTLPGPQVAAFASSVRRYMLEETRNVDAGIRASELSAILLGLEATIDDGGAPGADPLTEKIADGGGADLLVEVAHDMRSPLTSILFLVETLRSGHSGPVNGVQERQLGLIYSAAFALSSIASDVIEFARGTDRLMERTPIPFSVDEVFESVHDILRPMAEEKGLTLRLIPPPARYRIGYPAALSRVLLNLMTNGIKFTSRGMVELTAVQRSATRVEFAVRDSGKGIPHEVMGELFEPFRRGGPGSRSFSSAGLGLAICSRLVARMGGDLRVESAPGEGTRFSFELDLPIDSRF